MQLLSGPRIGELSAGFELTGKDEPVVSKPFNAHVVEGSYGLFVMAAERKGSYEGNPNTYIISVRRYVEQFACSGYVVAADVELDELGGQLQRWNQQAIDDEVGVQ